MNTDIDELARRFRELGYTAKNGVLYSPSGYATPSVIRDSGTAHLAAVVADKVEAMQKAAVERDGKRGLKGMVLYTVPTRF